ncbi:adenine deaminase C-terminal domain-containing protein, partial [Thermodesulfobacteriota bacterium]
AVIERHRGSGRIGMGLVRGFGLQGGAIASSVAHDSHNVIVVGTNDRDMCHAAETLREMGGGMVAVRSEKTLAKVPLQVAGLMSVESVDVLVKQLNILETAVASLGCTISDPFMRLSFLALPVIPQLRLTDRGLVDVDAFDLVPLFVQER